MTTVLFILGLIAICVCILLLQKIGVARSEIRNSFEVLVNADSLAERELSVATQQNLQAFNTIDHFDNLQDLYVSSLEPVSYSKFTPKTQDLSPDSIYLVDARHLSFFKTNEPVPLFWEKLQQVALLNKSEASTYNTIHIGYKHYSRAMYSQRVIVLPNFLKSTETCLIN